MLYRTLKRLINLGKTEGLEERIDVFFAVGKLTEEEYNELIESLKKVEKFYLSVLRNKLKLQFLKKQFVLEASM